MRAFSGIQPTGGIHIGNYLGALRHWVTLQDTMECLYCVVDQHAITVDVDPEKLRASIVHAASIIIACGVDPSRSILFCQSDNPDHTSLAWHFLCVARIGWLNRMTQFKDKAGKNKENASIGLYTYPVLMAADILAYQATHVPVGEDQKQHLELARDIAQKFNHDTKTHLFPIVEPVINADAARVMSLRDGTAKMSKSDPSAMSCIFFHDSDDEIAKKIRKAKSDPLPLPQSTQELSNRPEAQNLIGMFAALTHSSNDAALSMFGGRPFSDLKKELTDALVATVAPIRSESQRLQNDHDHIQRILAEGAERAQKLSAPILQRVRQATGFFMPC